MLALLREKKLKCGKFETMADAIYLMVFCWIGWLSNMYDWIIHGESCFRFGRDIFSAYRSREFWPFSLVTSVNCPFSSFGSGLSRHWEKIISRHHIQCQGLQQELRVIILDILKELMAKMNWIKQSRNKIHDLEKKNTMTQRHLGEILRYSKMMINHLVKKEAATPSSQHNFLKAI